MRLQTFRAGLMAAALTTFMSLPAAAAGFDHSAYGGLLNKAVEGNLVDYRAVGKHMKVLDTYLARVAVFDINKLSTPEAKLAFYANAYNATVLKAVVMHRTPKSVLDVPGFFDKLKYKIAGENLTLNQLEEKKLRSSGDARVHFVLNCASISCPPLHRVAFTGANWTELLEQKTKQYLQRRGEVMIDNNLKTITIVSLFDWYRGDWENDKGVREFLTTYLPDEAMKLKNDGYTLKYYKYDWKLNKL